MKKPFLRFRLSSLLLAVTLVGALLALGKQHQEVRRLRAIVECGTNCHATKPTWHKAGVAFL